MWAFMQQQQQQQMMLMELLAKRTGTEDPARRFTMREAGSLPKGTPHDLQNLDQWMAEFERLAKLKGGDLQEKCSWIVNCWDLETTAGKKLRNIMKGEDYRTMEGDGSYAGCWRMLRERWRALQATTSPR